MNSWVEFLHFFIASASVPACRLPAWIPARDRYYVELWPESWKELCALQVVFAHGIYHSHWKQARAACYSSNCRSLLYCILLTSISSALSFCPLGGSHGFRRKIWWLGELGWTFKEHRIRSILRQSLRRQIHEILLKFHSMLRFSSEKSEPREGRKSGRKGGRVRER